MLRKKFTKMLFIQICCTFFHHVGLQLPPFSLQLVNLMQKFSPDHDSCLRLPTCFMYAVHVVNTVNAKRTQHYISYKVTSRCCLQENCTFLCQLLNVHQCVHVKYSCQIRDTSSYLTTAVKIGIAQNKAKPWHVNLK